MCNDRNNLIPIATIKRLPIYLSVINDYMQKGKTEISSNKIAHIINENPSLVKKDLSYVISKEGKPKIGYEIKSLIADLKSFLSNNHFNKAVIVGTGLLGSALMSYNGFDEYNLQIECGFDIDKTKINTEISNKKIYDINNLEDFVKQNNIKIGIITTPQNYAQKVAEMLIRAGIKAIWNFTSSHIDVSKNIIIKNEDLATSLVVISKQLENL
ncbi:MAG: redox-sensing transcriptional repressor Rex [Clostridia bacterium]|nr:redox-sensing transcriptional repressor Rex [Clostridia bacterium]